MNSIRFNAFTFRPYKCWLWLGIDNVIEVRFYTRVIMLLLLEIFLYLHYCYYFCDDVMLCNSVLINVYVMPCYLICDCLYKCMLLPIFIQSVSRLRLYDKILISIAVVAFACLSVTTTCIVVETIDYPTKYCLYYCLL